ncbi:PorV/PorQ family protein [Calditrichota bacterium]
MKYLNLFFIIIFLSYFCFAQTPASSAGTASNLMLRFGISTRATGLSEAFTGLANDENSLLYNPGGLPNIKTGIVSLNHVEWFEDIRVDNITFGYNFKGDLGIGFAISHMWLPTIQGRDEFGRDTEQLNVSSSIINLGLGYKFHPGFFAGIGIKYFKDNLANYSANGIALDLGLFLKTSIPGLTAGFALQNFGGEIQYNIEKQRIPLTYRTGLAYKLYKPNVTISLDMVKSVDTDFKTNIGIEYSFIDNISIRLGNRIDANESFLPAFGTGFQFQDQFNLNYTFFNLSDLGPTHRIGFTYQFSIPSIKKWQRSLRTNYEKNYLLPPKSTHVELEEDKLLLFWDKVEGVKYNVYAKYGENGNWTKITNSPSSSRVLKINKRPEEGMYSFKITSVKEERESTFSREARINVE